VRKGNRAVHNAVALPSLYFYIPSC
jgi:hypothetical protein